MMSPPTTPAIIPEKRGAPDARAIPKHSGSATKNTTSPAESSRSNRESEDESDRGEEFIAVLKIEAFDYPS
jgi:hypothetical protein